MIWFFYNILFTVGYVLMLPRFLLRMRKRGGYSRHFLQRIGIYRSDIREALNEGDRIWVHAVSVGELYVALRFIKEIRSREPGSVFVLSVTTSTAFKIAVEELPPEDVLIYFPVDFPLVVCRVLKLIRPRAIALMEGEIWPNLIRLAHKRGIPVSVVNGRLSARSHRGYKKLSLFTRKLFPMVNLFAVQSEGDRDRLLDLGAPESQVKVYGSAKYDVASRNPEKEAAAAAFLSAVGISDTELVLLGGSTWPGEEEALADLYRKLLDRGKKLALVIVPRHVERTPEIVTMLEERGFRVMLKSELKEDNLPTDINDPFIVVVNTTGELSAFYACADIIFVGKSLTQHGGQNIIEPALYSKPILVGPNMENFPVVTQDFLEAEGLLQVASPAILENQVFYLLDDEKRRAELGERAARVVVEKRGSLKKTAESFLEFLA